MIISLGKVFSMTNHVYETIEHRDIPCNRRTTWRINTYCTLAAQVCVCGCVLFFFNYRETQSQSSPMMHWVNNTLEHSPLGREEPNWTAVVLFPVMIKSQMKDNDTNYAGTDRKGRLSGTPLMKRHSPRHSGSSTVEPQQNPKNERKRKCIWLHRLSGFPLTL